MKSTKKYLYKRFFTGGRTQLDVKNEVLKSNALDSSGTGKDGGQAIADGLGKVPVIGAFKGIGEGGANMIRQQDQYGVAKSDGQAVGGAVFNPLNSTTDGISAIAKGDVKGAALNLLLPWGAAGMKNKEQAKARDIALAENYKNKVLDEGEFIAVNSNTFGNENAANYKNGGKLFPKLDGFIKFATGGKLNKLSNDAVEVEGKSHENGGVKFPSQGIELEGGETMHKDFVFSKELGFAKQHKPIAKAIGKLEKSERKDNTTVNTIARLKDNEENLKKEQEETKMMLGIPSDLGNMKMGGVLTKFAKGGDSNTVKKQRPTPNFTEDDLRILSKFKANPDIYKRVHNQMIGYTTPTNPRGQSAEHFDQLYDQSINNFNSRDTTKGVSYPFISEYEKEMNDYNISNNLRGSSNVKLDKYANERGAEIANSNYTTIKKMGGKLYKKMWDGGYNSKFSWNKPDRENYVESDDMKPISYKSSLVNTNDNPNVGTQLPMENSTGTSGKKFAVNGSSLSGITNYTDNMFNYFANRQRARTKLPQLERSAYYNPNLINTNKEESEADRQRLLMNKSIDATNTDSGVSNANKGRLLLNTILAKNNVISQKNRTNIGIQNDAQVRNIDIRNTNNKIDFDNAMRPIMQQDDVRREDSTNVANATNKMIQSKNVRDAKDSVVDQNIIDLASKDPKTVEKIFKNNPELYKNITTKKNRKLFTKLYN